MDHHMGFKLFQTLSFHPVDLFMGNHGVHMAVHLHMNAGISSSRPVIMHHQIMAAQDHGTGIDIICQLLSKIRVDPFPQQRRHRFLCQLDPAAQNKQRNQNSHHSIDLQPGKMLRYRSDQNCPCGQHIISAVRCRCKQRRGLKPLPHFSIKDHHSRLDQYGKHKHPDRQGRKDDLCRMQKLFHRAFCKLEADHQDHHGNR